MRCDECKHWDKDDEDRIAGLGYCRRAHAFWDRSEWRDEDDGTYHRVLLPEAAGDMMFCQDGSDYLAFLITKAQFYCAHFETV